MTLSIVSAAAIRGLTRTKKPLVGLVVAMGDWGKEGRNFDMVQEQLAKSYTVVPVSLGDSTQPADSIKTLLMAGQPDSLPPGVRARLEQFLRAGWKRAHNDERRSANYS